MLQQYAQIEKVYKNSGGSDEDMWEERRVDLSKVTREKPVLFPTISYQDSIGQPKCVPWQSTRSF